MERQITIIIGMFISLLLVVLDASAEAKKPDTSGWTDILNKAYAVSFMREVSFCPRFYSREKAIEVLDPVGKKYPMDYLYVLHANAKAEIKQQMAWLNEQGFLASTPDVSEAKQENKVYRLTYKGYQHTSLGSNRGNNLCFTIAHYEITRIDNIQGVDTGNSGLTAFKMMFTIEPILVDWLNGNLPAILKIKKKQLQRRSIPAILVKGPNGYYSPVVNKTGTRHRFVQIPSLSKLNGMAVTNEYFLLQLCNMYDRHLQQNKIKSAACIKKMADALHIHAVGKSPRGNTVVFNFSYIIDGNRPTFGSGGLNYNNLVDLWQIDRSFSLLPPPDK